MNAFGTTERIRPRFGHSAFTRKELLAVVAVLLFMAWFLGSAIIQAREQADTIRCANQLKIVGLSFRTFANDHNDRYPFYAMNSATIDPSDPHDHDAWLYFQMASNEFAMMSNTLATARVLTCPADRERVRNVVDDFAKLTMTKNASVSYFIGISADERQPGGLLAGDRCVSTNRHRLEGKVLGLTSSESLQWENPFHHFAGNVVLSDGSVQQLWGAQPQTSLSLSQSVETNRLLLPLLP